MNDSNFKPKIDFVRDHMGIFQAILVVGVLAILGLGGYFLLPFIIEILKNVVLTTLLALAVIVLLFPVLNGDMRKGIILFFENQGLKMKNAIIQQDPFATAQNMIKRLIKRKEEMAGYIISLKSSLDKLTTTINKFQASRARASSLAGQAQSEGNEVLTTRYANTAERYNESIQRLVPLQSTAKGLCVFLIKMQEAIDAKVGEEQEALKIALEEYNITEQSRGAVQAAKAVMGGDDSDMFDQSMDIIATRTAQSLAEVEMFMEMTQPMLDAKDFEDRAKSKEAVASFRKWIQADSTLIPAAEKKQLLISSGVGASILGPDSKVEVPIEDNTGNRRPMSDKYGLLGRK